MEFEIFGSSIMNKLLYCLFPFFLRFLNIFPVKVKCDVLEPCFPGTNKGQISRFRQRRCPIPTLRNVIVSLPDSATLLNMPSATLSRAIATSIFTILASYALWDSHSPSRRKQRLRRQVRKKNLFTYAAP